MNVFIPAKCVRCDTPGNEGVTGIICLETSHASVHVWDSGYLKFDLYSCKEFDIERVLDLFAIFQPVAANFTLMDRNGTTAVEVMQGFRLFDINTADIESTINAVHDMRADATQE